ncbi:MAG: VOC family protein, partial [Nitrososphaerales archaeon]
MIDAVHHSCFTVSNLERSIAFYRDVLGLELVLTERSEASGDDRSETLGVAKSKLSLAIFRIGDTHLELIEYIT